MLRLRRSARACRRLRGVGGSALARKSLALLGRWQRRVGVGTLSRQAADASGRAARSHPRVKVGGGAAALASLGSRHGWRRAKMGGGSGACFACVARLALVGDGGALGVVCWWGMSGRQRWRVGGWRCHSFGAGMLVSEEEGPDNQHEWKG